MLVSIRHHLVILAMPKCASSSLETALRDKADLVLSGAPGIKHTNFRKYDRFLRPYLESVSKEPFEVVSLYREPLDWLHSWWRYRGRDGMANPENSTKGMSFEEFIEAYLDDQRKPADVGRQSRFVARPDGSIGVDRIFRHDRMAHFTSFLERRFDCPLNLGRLNVSPSTNGHDTLSPDLHAAALAELARDYEIYNTVAE